MNENEITIENVVGPKLATKLTDKTQRFVNEHLTNDGLKQQVNGLKRLQKTVNPEQIAKVIIACGWLIMKQDVGA
ncbi:hypothetical protein [Lactiplantibacillus plantarum]|uniref:hypothetical protein n=1 Tax=Lactiplantibacillus plantarum TaxID=1590 RepID=UPI0020A2D26C|nr:hypothetical protein [Lactiplantibacillus plantarum]